VEKPKSNGGECDWPALSPQGETFQLLTTHFFFVVFHLFFSFFFPTRMFDCVCAAAGTEKTWPSVSGLFRLRGSSLTRVYTSRNTHQTTRRPFSKTVPPLVAPPATTAAAAAAPSSKAARTLLHTCVCRVGKRKPRIFFPFFLEKKKFLKACAPRSHILTRAPSRIHKS